MSIDVAAAAMPDHALIRVRGAARECGPQRLRIGRNPDGPDPHLGAGGWQLAEADLQPLDVRADGPDLVLLVGPDICRHLCSETYTIAIYPLRAEATVAWPEVAPAWGGRKGVLADTRPPRTAAPPPRPAPSPPAAAPLQSPMGAAPTRNGDADGALHAPAAAHGVRRRKHAVAWPWVMLGLVLLAGAAYGMYRYRVDLAGWFARQWPAAEPAPLPRGPAPEPQTRPPAIAPPSHPEPQLRPTEPPLGSRPSLPPGLTPEPPQAYRDGYGDGIAWLNWFNAQSGSYKDGAAFWAAHRSDTTPPFCSAAGFIGGPEAAQGCEDAKARLDPSDQRRRLNPDYRKGWNDYLLNHQ